MERNRLKIRLESGFGSGVVSDRSGHRVRLRGHFFKKRVDKLN